MSHFCTHGPLGCRICNASLYEVVDAPYVTQEMVTITKTYEQGLVDGRRQALTTLLDLLPEPPDGLDTFFPSDAIIRLIKGEIESIENTSTESLK